MHGRRINSVVNGAGKGGREWTPCGHMSSSHDVLFRGAQITEVFAVQSLASNILVMVYSARYPCDGLCCLLPGTRTRKSWRARQLKIHMHIPH